MHLASCGTDNLFRAVSHWALCSDQYLSELRISIISYTEHTHTYIQVHQLGWTKLAMTYDTWPLTLWPVVWWPIDYVWALLGNCWIAITLHFIWPIKWAFLEDALTGIFSFCNFFFFVQLIQNVFKIRHVLPSRTPLVGLRNFH